MSKRKAARQAAEARTRDFALVNLTRQVEYAKKTGVAALGDRKPDVRRPR